MSVRRTRRNYFPSPECEARLAGLVLVAVAAVVGIDANGNDYDYDNDAALGPISIAPILILRGNGGEPPLSREVMRRPSVRSSGKGKKEEKEKRTFSPALLFHA